MIATISLILLVFMSFIHYTHNSIIEQFLRWIPFLSTYFFIPILDFLYKHFTLIMPLLITGISTKITKSLIILSIIFISLLIFFKFLYHPSLIILALM